MSGQRRSDDPIAGIEHQPPCDVRVAALAAEQELLGQWIIVLLRGATRRRTWRTAAASYGCRRSALQGHVCRPSPIKLIKRSDIHTVGPMDTWDQDAH